MRKIRHLCIIVTEKYKWKTKKNTRDVASIFSVSMCTILRIWKRSLENIENGTTNISHRKTKNCGRK